MGQLRCARGRDGEIGLIVLGLDPGLGSTGWGVIEASGNRLRHIANGQIATSPRAEIAARLVVLSDALEAVMRAHQPSGAALEEIFVNSNAQSTIKLAQARGVALLALGKAHISVGEYAPSVVKKSVVGTGAADKVQVRAMVSRLLPGVVIAGSDAGDALAVAITHAHHLAATRRMS